MTAAAERGARVSVRVEMTAEGATETQAYARRMAQEADVACREGRYAEAAGKAIAALEIIAGRLAHLIESINHIDD